MNAPYDFIYINIYIKYNYVMARQRHVRIFRRNVPDGPGSRVLKVIVLVIGFRFTEYR